ncbi:MAG: hypothetical protein CMH15_09870 [Mesonia sp.]|uniref:Uncharacterized protein n=1 Tax=Mesonia oceanica TaxID=2687242 RepID=A0AC61Y396_9FLAO|nr:hypothetical protein [Mesonia sp.]MAQ41334.1 hypothetical protein [Mesonia sp.]MBJ97433.1 hypothetical protein [Flavobacteriaceae bacterium]VVU98907.1 hypothetical protein FVB9532_00156 [Mesonia oceanica]|tara:strand:- start:354 stop:857 length:504 start_codon:yes stop_codon:yes gene_type:complete
MAIWAKIKQLNLKQAFILGKTFLFRPGLLFPTYRATKKTVGICNRLFGKAHHKDNETNAFRHALWNFLIAEESLPQLKEKSKAIAWAKEITDLHEKLSPNPALPRAMDLHNNQIGRNLFQQEIPSEEIIEKLREMMKDAKQINQAEQVSNHTNRLVYIEKNKHSKIS